MKVKRILGICDGKGCKHKATRLLILKDKNGKTFELHLCESCTWVLYSGEER